MVLAIQNNLSITKIRKYYLLLHYNHIHGVTGRVNTWRKQTRLSSPGVVPAWPAVNRWVYVSGYYAELSYDMIVLDRQNLKW